MSELDGVDLDNYTCPILRTIMRDPVVASDGHTYERAAMEEWIRTCEEVDVLSPLTGFPLKSRILFANHALRRSISDLMQRYPHLESQMTSPQDVSTLVHNFKNPPPPRPDSPPLIDLRTEEEIAAAEQARQLEDVTVGIAKLPSRFSESTEDGSMKIASYTLAIPHNFLLSARYSHHSVADELHVYKSSVEGDFSTAHVLKLPTTESVMCTSLMRIPSRETGVAVSAEYVVTGGGNGRIRLFEYEREKKSLRQLRSNSALESAHFDTIRTISTWPHGVANDAVHPLVISGSRDSTLKVWRAETSAPCNGSWDFELASVLKEHTDFVSCSDVEIGSGMLLSGGEDWKACLWDLNRLDAGCLSSFSAHSYGIRCCSWSTSGQHVLSPYEDSPSSSTTSMSLGGAVFATGGDDEMVYVIDPRAKYDGNVARLRTGCSVLACCWGPSDQSVGPLPWLAAGGGLGFETFSSSSENVEGWVRVYDPRMWKAIGDCCSYDVTPLRAAQKTTSKHKVFANVGRHDSCEGDSNKMRQAHKTVVSSLSPIRIADGTVALMSCGGDDMIRIWKLPQGPGGFRKPQLYQEIQGPEAAVNASILLL